MKFCAPCLLFATALACLLPCVASTTNAQSADGSAPTQTHRGFTIEDAIAFRHFAPLRDLHDTERILWSPSRKRFVVMTRYGDLAANVERSELVLFECDSGRTCRWLQVIASLGSPGEPVAINQARWVSDNELTFLGVDGKTPAQVYLVDVDNGSPRPLTSNPTEVVFYDYMPAARRLFFLAKAPDQPLIPATTRDAGLLIEGQNLWDLLSNQTWKDYYGMYVAHGLYVQDLGGTVQQIPVARHPIPQVFKASPDGRYLVYQIYETMDARARWSAYALGRSDNNYPISFRMVDTKTGRDTPVIDVPTSNADPGDIRWISNDTLVVANTLGANPTLPPDNSTGVVSIDAVTMTPRLLYSGRVDELHASSDTGEAEVRVDKRWIKLIPGSKPDSAIQAQRSDVRILEGMNHPAQLVQGSGDKLTVLFDPNPALEALLITPAVERTWRASTGEAVKYAYYAPLGWKLGDPPPPLVVQTHGWDSSRFLPEGGPNFAGFAAQALAARGIAVVQLPDVKDWQAVPAEAELHLAFYEGVLDDLVSAGLADRDRLALHGWSRTVYHVSYALTFSTKYRFRAAALCEGSELSYWLYIANLNQSNGPTGLTLKFFEARNGGDPPFGEGLKKWTERATGFNLQSVTAAVRLLPLSAPGLLTQWEWFAGLKYLGKPVELIYLPDASHDPRNPMARLAVQGGNVDWFDFWLTGHIDPDPDKAMQYDRWRQLRSNMDLTE